MSNDNAPAIRFSETSHREALVKAQSHGKWVVDGIISASSTLIYGEAKVGKSFLVSALIASLTTGEPFLGREVPPDGESSVAVCWTDDSGDRDYAEQVQSVLPDGTGPSIRYYCLPIMKNSDHWQALYDRVNENCHNFVVIDNMTQCLDGSINEDDAVRQFFDGVRLFTRAGIPVVIVGHSSDKAGHNGVKSDKPMGSSFISQAARWRCFVRRSRNGNLTLSFTGNHADPHEITVRHGAGARFEVIGSQDADALKAGHEARSQQRSSERLDANRKAAQWVVYNCQGMNVTKACSALSGWSGRSEGACRNDLKGGGRLSSLLGRDDTTWYLHEQV